MNPHSTTDSLSLSAKPTKKMRTLAFAVSTALLSLSLTACGGSDATDTNHHDSSNHNNTDSTNNTTASAFTEKATWTVDSTQAGTTCYDFDTKTEVKDCQGNNWDVKFDNQARSVQLWTNSGISGNGKGAAFYTSSLQRLKQVTDATDENQTPAYGYKADSGKGVFSENKWYAYNLNDKHKLFPNYRVYLVTNDSNNASIQGTAMNPVYAMQITGYYNDANESGYPTIRWIDTAMPNQPPREKTIDASSHTKWTYVNLKTGEIVPKDGDWQVGFQRTSIVLNGGASGTANVGGYLAKTPTGYYDDKGQPIKAKFNQDNSQETLADLTNITGYDIDKDGVPWVKDTAHSQLNPERKGSYPNLDYGWYTYDGNTHRLATKTEDKAIASIIRSGEGNSYALMQLVEIKYPNATSMQPSQWVFEFDIQPAKSKN